MKTLPRRIQLSRAKGWRMPPNTVKVDRSTRYGNPFTEKNSGKVDPVVRFACEAAPLLDLSRLRGKNVGCWCKLCPKHKDGLPLGTECDDCASCHGDVVLELANT